MSAPNAPTDFTAAVIGDAPKGKKGGERLVHFSWTDNSDDEARFVISGSNDKGNWIDTQPFANIVSCDVPLKPGAWDFKIVARKFEGTDQHNVDSAPATCSLTF